MKTKVTRRKASTVDYDGNLWFNLNKPPYCPICRDGIASQGFTDVEKLCSVLLRAGYSEQGVSDLLSILSEQYRDNGCQTVRNFPLPKPVYLQIEIGERVW